MKIIYYILVILFLTIIIYNYTSNYIFETMLDKNYSIIKNVPYYKSISKIHGYGIFASENIKKNTIISKCFDEIKTRDNKPTADFTNICKFINHSYNPNSKLKKIKNIYYLLAIKDINMNEEIIANYQDTPSYIKKPESNW